MKIIVALVVSIPAVAAAFDMPLPLPDMKIELPALSLVGSALERAPGFVGDFQRQHQLREPPPRLVSRMPVIAPPCEVDSKMVKEPDRSVDYKLIVKNPDIGTQK
jgi:hypothetical protein